MKTFINQFNRGMKKLTILFVAIFAMGSAVAQMQPEPIPVDKELRMGKLPNGMTYYIRHNEKPKGQADFYILHNVGAIQENDSQQGLAHFLEHMAFNGTKNLEGKTIIEYLEKVGVNFGYNLNAATGWDNTTYQMTDVPTSRQGIIDSALLILHDWSHFIALHPEEIDSERGVIMEELRTRDGAAWRSQIEMIKAIGKGSKYEHRNLIGYLDGLKGFQHKDLEEFYQTWYRPEHQAVIVVGDIDVDAIEKQIASLMSDIPASPADALKKEPVIVPDNEQPIVSIYTDPEMQGSRIILFVKRPALPNELNNTIAGEAINVIEAYANTMEGARLQELAMKPDAPFLGAGMQMGSLGVMPTLNITGFIATTQDGKLAEGFESICSEMERLRRFGFTQSEFERAQENLLRSAERKYTNRNDRRNNEFVQNYLQNYQLNTPIPDAETEWKLDSMLIKQINVDAVNMYVQQTIYPQNQVIFITAPHREGVTNPTEAEILAIREKVMGSDLTPYEDNTVKEPLIPENVVLAGSPVVKTTENAKYGTTEWTLKNGVKVIVKPTTFKADEVRITAYAVNGLSGLTDEEYYMGELMPAVGQMSGVGKFSAADLRKQLSGKSARVQTSTSEYNNSIVGLGSPKDLETLLQLLYLNFTQPRFDENDYNTLMKMLRAQLENVRTNPDFVMQEKFTDVAYGHNPRRQVITIETLEGFSFDKLSGIYAKLFPGADSFTFCIVGNVDLNTLKPLVEKYIGSIPTTGKPAGTVDDKAAPVKGTVLEDFQTSMQQPKVSVHYRFTGDMPQSIRGKLALTLLTEALSTRYLTSIREEKGGTYGVQVYGSTQARPHETYQMNIRFDTNAEMADELRELVMQEVHAIAENGPKSEEIEKTREFLAKQWKNSLEQNGSWIPYLLDYELLGLDYITDYEDTLRSMTAADVQALAKKILEDNNLVQVVMRPAPAEEK